MLEVRKLISQWTLQSDSEWFIAWLIDWWIPLALPGKTETDTGARNNKDNIKSLVETKSSSSLKLSCNTKVTWQHNTAQHTTKPGLAWQTPLEAYSGFIRTKSTQFVVQFCTRYGTWGIARAFSWVDDPIPSRREDPILSILIGPEGRQLLMRVTTIQSRMQYIFRVPNTLPAHSWLTWMHEWNEECLG